MFEPDIRHGLYQEQIGAGEKFHLIVTSPPYNIGTRGPRKDGRRKIGQFDPRSYGGIRGYEDNMPEGEYQRGQIQFLLWCANHVTCDGVVAYNHKPRKRNKALIHPLQWVLSPEVSGRLALVEEIVWDRSSTHNHDLTQLWARTERIYVLRPVGGTWRFKNTSDLPQRSDVWRIGRGKFNGHACPYPVELAEAVIKAYSRPADVICDPFSGSGTTALAAMNLGRRFVGAELEEKYVDQSRAAVDAVRSRWGWST